MDGSVASGQLIVGNDKRLNNGLHFELATADHDAALRHLLRENPIPGPISISLERAPEFFAAGAVEGPEHQTIVAIEDGRVVATGSISARQRFINGEPMRVGYLSGLRLDRSCRGRSEIIRHGYDVFRSIHERGGPLIYLSSIIAGNQAALRFLERGLKGMPTYKFLGELVTLIIRRLPLFKLKDPASRARRALQKKGLRVLRGSHGRCADILEFLNRENREYQFAPVWSANDIRVENSETVYSSINTPAAYAAVWDQRAMKQSVVRGYSGSLKWARPFVNIAATFLGTPRLPEIGTPLSYVYVSHLAASSDQPELTECLINMLGAADSTHSADYLAIGFDARDPRLAHLRRAFRAREYVSRIYAVHWEDGTELTRNLDDRLLAPEVATL
ncbi:MAG: GNAT family N-acetyltransferase [Candidatus Sulfotelmatobacter sp.]